MSRREDANWGKTAAAARLSADFTCMHTNSCPQVKALNQNPGLWGRLETVVLEKGAQKEDGKFAKISVFNGPIFKATDPIYKGVQVPLSFFKIIVWYNDNLELNATGFKLSQSDLVGDIDFEAIDIDDNIEFKAYQCSIKSLESETKIDFSQLIKYDTYLKTNGLESLEMKTEADLNTLFGPQNTLAKEEIFISSN
jgi:endonuclease G